MGKRSLISLFTMLSVYVRRRWDLSDCSAVDQTYCVLCGSDSGGGGTRPVGRSFVSQYCRPSPVAAPFPPLHCSRPRCSDRQRRMCARRAAHGTNAAQRRTPRAADKLASWLRPAESCQPAPAASAPALAPLTVCLDRRLAGADASLRRAQNFMSGSRVYVRPKLRLGVGLEWT